MDIFRVTLIAYHMNSKLLTSIIALQKQTIYKTEYRMSIIKLKKLVTLFLLCKENERNEIIKRKYWVHPIFSNEKHERYGASKTLIKELYFHSDEKFINYFRMNVEIYEKLLHIVGSHITKQKCIRNSMPPNTRLEMSLLFNYRR